MDTDDLALLAAELLAMPELIGEPDSIFLKRRLDRNDWIAADEAIIRHLAHRLLVPVRTVERSC